MLMQALPWLFFALVVFADHCAAQLVAQCVMRGPGMQVHMPTCAHHCFVPGMLCGWHVCIRTLRTCILSISDVVFPTLLSGLLPGATWIERGLPVVVTFKHTTAKD